MLFTSADTQQIAKRGSQIAEVERQISCFQTGFPFLPLAQAATAGNGIVRLDSKDLEKYLRFYEKNASQKHILKFVPASGAATRMFQALFAFRDSPSNEIQDSNVQAFFDKLERFAFYDSLKKILSQNNFSLENLLKNKEYKIVLDYLLGEKGLNYGNLPKGLLEFHLYASQSRTPAEEHLVEGANYAQNAKKEVFVHFTVSPEHRQKFDELMAKVVPAYEKQFGVAYKLSFSEQKPATDTIAVDLDNQPFRNLDGTLLFRPAGHGALLSNLNDLEADIVFIKNIDNVTTDRLKADTYEYKKALAGLLMTYQTNIFKYLAHLNESADLSDHLLSEVNDFLEKELFVKSPNEFKNWDKKQKISYLVGKLNRPLRVCGMVRNEGEPGGGPFWVRNADGSVSLQIAESAQIDMKNADQKSIAQNASHFNPVDLVCAPKDWKGKKFDLQHFTDPTTGFISEKSKDGKKLKAQELPGLWNGAMANWNTIFVEVPISTFTPVKTVNDLLREQHQ